MAADKVFIDLCSSDEEVEDSGDENDYIEEELEEDTSLSDDDTSWSENDASESDLDHHEHEEAVEQGEDDKESVVNKVTLLLKAESDLKSLNLKECKTYLRAHGLRLGGTKAICIERILKHWRIKGGKGEVLYPRSSFVINCKGDVCKGDIVLFTQKVHDKFDKMKRSGKILGRRAVAGQVIKESYGTAKQQHTFTIEVLWSMGLHEFPPLYPLLVKGRNLYRSMTYRQPWANEADRVKVLTEKHSRGAVARRVMRDRKIKLGYVYKDGILQKPGKTKKPVQGKTRKTEKVEQPKVPHATFTDRYRPDTSVNHSLVIPNQNPPQVRKKPGQGRTKKTEKVEQPKGPHENLTHRYRPDISIPVIPNQNPPLERKKPSRWGPPIHNHPLHSYSTHSHAPQLHQPTTYATRAPPPIAYAPGPSNPPFNIPPSHRPPPPHSYANPTQNQSNQRPPASNVLPGQPGFHNSRPAPSASNVLQGQQSSYNGRLASNVLQGQQSSYNGRLASNVLQGQQSSYNGRLASSVLQRQQAFYKGRPPSNSLEGQPSSNAQANTSTIPATRATVNSDYNHEIRGLNHFSEMAINHRADRHTSRQSDNTRRTNYR